MDQILVKMIADAGLDIALVSPIIEMAQALERGRNDMRQQVTGVSKMIEHFAEDTDEDDEFAYDNSGNINTTVNDVLEYLGRKYSGLSHIARMTQQTPEELAEKVYSDGMVDLKCGDPVYVVVDHDSKHTVEGHYIGYYFDGSHMSHLIFFQGCYGFYGDNQFTYGNEDYFDEPKRITFDRALDVAEDL